MVDHDATASLTPSVRGSDTPALRVARGSDTPSIPGYELTRMIGAGGMGRVWRARQRSVGREVALKVLDPHLGADPSYAERFLREARAAASVHHTNVCACFDAGEADGRHYLALEFVPGGDAAELIRRRGGRLGIEEAIALACDCARGLEAIAAAGLIHRDIKPSNILLTADPSAGGVAKLGDFGLARQAGAEAKLTRTGATLGTPAYMAPEQARGERTIDIRADIYALGASLFEMLTGEQPFAGETAYAVVSQVLKGPTPDPRARNRKVSPALSAVVMRAMARTPAERYASPTELRQDLEKLIRGELPQAFLATAGANLSTGILTRPAGATRTPVPEPSAMAAPPSPRNAAWRAAAIALAIGLLGLGAVILLGDRPKDEAAGSGASPMALPPLPAHPAPVVTVGAADGPFAGPPVAAPATPAAPAAPAATAATARAGSSIAPIELAEPATLVAPPATAPGGAAVAATPPAHAASSAESAPAAATPTPPAIATAPPTAAAAPSAPTAPPQQAQASGTASPFGLPPPAQPTRSGGAQRPLDALPPPPNVAAP